MPVVGDVLVDRYRIESVLGSGGMASVYQAVDLRLDRSVAVKVLAANLAADPQFAERFDREARAMAGFSHPNVVAVYDVEPGDPTTGREPFYVMEFCEGGSLADRLKASGTIPPAELIPIVDAVAGGLTEMHRRGLIHRDIKPANILFAGDRPKLADFGIARSEDDGDRTPLTATGSTLGTLPYLAPEVVAGQPATAASDVYALAATIFLALTGQLPSEPAAGTAAGSPDARQPAVSAVSPGVGRGFDAALARGLDANPAIRPSPSDLSNELAGGLEIWGVAQPNPSAVGAASALGGSGSGVDLDAPTVVAVNPPPKAAPRPPVLPPSLDAPQPAGPPPTPRQSVRPKRPDEGPSTAGSRLASLGPITVVVAVLAILVALVLPRLLGPGGSIPATTPLAEVTTPPSSALPSGTQAAFEALGRVDAVIEAARGGKDGLSGRDGNELATLAASVRTALDRGDGTAALAAARQLSDRARALATNLDKTRRDALLASIDALISALGP
jgi:serine/threonine protein kinase